MEIIPVDEIVTPVIVEESERCTTAQLQEDVEPTPPDTAGEAVVKVP